jgi:hypothetical protein
LVIANLLHAFDRVLHNIGQLSFLAMKFFLNFLAFCSLGLKGIGY